MYIGDFIYNLKSNAVLNIPISLLLKHSNQTFIDHITEWELNMQSCEIGKRHKFDIFLKKAEVGFHRP